ncbi:hypothetical protein AAJCM20276_32930 [Acetobacter aceti]|uniref:Uncharacterized protein n=1 Tax=Acetobacter aceti TaxID=435 RepID=A0A6S6PMI8_ACEAC|nr:hypothetical protein AAJCM20276_32930 [Acetobacter aceti]
MLWLSITAGVAACLNPVHHQFHVMDSLEQEAAGQFAKPAIDRASVPEVDRQHPDLHGGTCDPDGSDEETRL